MAPETVSHQSTRNEHDITISNDDTPLFGVDRLWLVESYREISKRREWHVCMLTAWRALSDT